MTDCSLLPCLVTLLSQAHPFHSATLFNQPINFYIVQGVSFKEMFFEASSFSQVRTVCLLLLSRVRVKRRASPMLSLLQDLCEWGANLLIDETTGMFVGTNCPDWEDPHEYNVRHGDYWKGPFCYPCGPDTPPPTQAPTYPPPSSSSLNHTTGHLALMATASIVLLAKW